MADSDLSWTANHPGYAEKQNLITGANAPFSCHPARTGAGRARKMGQGTRPLWGLGQRPKV